MTRTIVTSADPVSIDTVFQRAGQGLLCWVASDGGVRRPVPMQRWMGTSAAASPDREADAAMLDQCTGLTIDLGCGPGRLTAALTARGVAAIGVDSSATAVAMTTSRGGKALHQNIFDPLPMVGHWAHVLLADGNIGIGADPERILRRAAELIARDGVVIAEVEPSAAAVTGIRIEQLRWETEELQGHWFDWATVGREAVPALAAAAGLQVTRTMELAQRCFVWLEPSDGLV